MDRRFRFRASVQDPAVRIVSNGIGSLLVPRIDNLPETGAGSSPGDAQQLCDLRIVAGHRFFPDGVFDLLSCFVPELKVFEGPVPSGSLRDFRGCSGRFPVPQQFSCDPVRPYAVRVVPVRPDLPDNDPGLFRNLPVHDSEFVIHVKDRR